MKKVISLILALTMLLGLSTMALAAQDDDKVKIDFVVNGAIEKTIYVDYGEDYNSQAPKVKDYLADGKRYKFSGWDCHNKYYNAIYETLPAIKDTTPVVELTFYATYSEADLDVDTVVGDLVGDDIMSSLKTIWDEFLVFLKTVLLYLATFITIG